MWRKCGRVGDRSVRQSSRQYSRCYDSQNRERAYYSVTEVEVVVGVSVILTLAKDGADEVEGAGWESDAHPDAHAVVDDDTLQEEALDTAVHHVEDPLLGGIGAMVPDVTTSVR